MKTGEEIDNEHNANISAIRASHHEKHEISHEEYHEQLNAEDERHVAELALHFPSEPPRDLATEIDGLKAKLKQAGIT